MPFHFWESMKGLGPTRKVHPKISTYAASLTQLTSCMTNTRNKHHGHGFMVRISKNENN